MEVSAQLNLHVAGTQACPGRRVAGWHPDFGVECEDSKISAGTVSSPSPWQLLRARLGRWPGKGKCALHPCLHSELGGA